MKLQADRIEGVNVISSLERDAITVNGVVHQRSLLIPWQGQPHPWGRAGFEALVLADFDQLAELNPELVIFGSGARLRFASPSLMRGLMQSRIGIETMDTAAACRTFNVLVAESRRVVVALLLEGSELLRSGGQ